MTLGQRIEALVNPQMLVWARRRSHFDLVGAAKRVRVKPEKLQAWEEGKARPTIRQAMILAQIYRCPLSAFYLRERPRDVQIAIRDFRGPAPSPEVDWSPALAREHILAEERRNALLGLADPEEGEFQPPEDLGTGEHPERIAFRLREYLGVSLEEQFRWAGVRQALRGWTEALEKKNVLVFQTKVRGHVLQPEEAHGFCVHYRKFPFIVINARDSVSRRIFTLLHEFAHLVMRQSAVCDPEKEDLDVSTRADDPEVLSNWIAGAVLVPLPELSRMAKTFPAARVGKWEEPIIRRLAGKFRVSREVIVRRLLAAGLTTREFYLKKRDEYQREWQLFQARRRTDEKTRRLPEAWSVLRENGFAYCRRVFRAYFDDQLTLTDVSDLLDTKIKHVLRIQERLFDSQTAA